MELTITQKHHYNQLRKVTKKHGYLPWSRLIKELGYSGLSACQYMIGILTEKGYVKRDGVARTISFPKEK